MSKNICVYSSSSNVIDPVFFRSANELAEKMAKKGHKLVYGGGCIGLMGEMARTMHHFGGFVRGIIPERLNIQGVCYDAADELIVTKDMRDRKALMEDHSDAFIALPGGFGTLEEISEIITGKQLGFHNKPAVILNIDGFYNPLIEFFENIYGFKFSKPAFRDSYLVTASIDEGLEYIETYIPSEQTEKYYFKV
jgi:uncharacterized protein (TIGR00730 family)